MSTREVLALPAFRRLFLSRTISNLGNGMGPIALAFGVLALPDSSPTDLSIVLAAQALPVIVTLPFGGVVADRVGRTRVIATTDMILSLVAATIGLLFITGSATVPLLAALAAVAGVLNGLWYPAFGGLMPDVVPDEHLQPANALTSIAANGGLIVGTAIGGSLVALVGSGWAILIDAATFLVAGALVFTLRHLSTKHESEGTVLADLRHGWTVFLSYRWVVAVVAAFSLIVMVMRGAEEVLGPVLANERYGGAAGWALVMASMSVGLLVGGLLASRLHVRRPLVVGMLVCLALPAWLLLLAAAAPLPLAAAGAFAWGLAVEVFYVLWMTAIQEQVPRESLSRVSAYDAMGSLMFGPIGLALAGPLVGIIGLPAAFTGAAVIACACIVAPLAVKSVRRVTSSTGAAREPAGGETLSL